MEAKIFVTDYASYNNGTQFDHGHWVDLSEYSDLDSLNHYLENHFNGAGIEDPEIMITDFEGFPRKFYSESYDSNLMQELFDFLDILKNCHEPDALMAYVEYGNDAGDFEEAYAGQYDSDADFAQDMAEQLDCLDKNSSWPQNCINWDLAARDLMYDYFETSGYYFRSI
jgi:antirestriction protein